MSSAPTRASLAGRTYLALRKKAREMGRPTDELLQFAALEAFVDRMASSPRAPDLVLKGGVLLAAYDARRPTRDVDLAARNMSNDLATVTAVVNEILAVPLEDGWTFAVPSAETIREEDVYSGVRVSVPCALASAKLTFNVDVNVGDVVVPPPVDVKLPRLLGGEIRTKGYPLSMVLAEKITTAVQRRTVNTRWRDFADMFLISRAHDLAGSELVQSVRAVAEHRATPLVALSSVLVGYASLRQDRWAAWVRKQNLTQVLSLDFASVLERVEAFADPVLSGTAREQYWLSAEQRWARSV